MHATEAQNDLEGCVSLVIVLLDRYSLHPRDSYLGRTTHNGKNYM